MAPGGGGRAEWLGLGEGLIWFDLIWFGLI